MSDKPRSAWPITFPPPRAYRAGMERTSWFEISFPKGDGRSGARDSFLEDCCKTAAECGAPIDELLVDDAGFAERFLIPPEVAAAYFFHPYRSAIADWLLDTGLARPCEEAPDTSGFRPLSCRR